MIDLQRIDEDIVFRLGCNTAVFPRHLEGDIIDVFNDVFNESKLGRLISKTFYEYASFVLVTNAQPDEAEEIYEQLAELLQYDPHFIFKSVLDFEEEEHDNEYEEFINSESDDEESEEDFEEDGEWVDDDEDELDEDIQWSFVMLIPEKGYYDWVKMVSGQAIEDKEIHKVYELPLFKLNEIQKIVDFVEQNYIDFFENELRDRFSDSDFWPKDRTLDLFREWFKLIPITEITSFWDLGIEDEE